MSEISERYRRLSSAFAECVAGVAEDQWDEPTPCEDWTARELVKHVADTQGLFLGFVGRDLGSLPDVTDDPVAAWSGASAVVQRELDDPERAAATYEGLWGETTFEAGVDRFLNFDLVVHRWDLATATGQDDRMDPADVERAWRDAESFGDAARTPGVFGPEVQAPSDADEQARLLAFLGRKPV
jgi:uncharacterized protein (TIGR03086 family)